MGCGDKKLSKYLTQTFTAHCNAMICQQVTLSGDAEWPKVADAVIEAVMGFDHRVGHMGLTDPSRLAQAQARAHHLPSCGPIVEGTAWAWYPLLYSGDKY